MLYDYGFVPRDIGEANVYTTSSSQSISFNRSITELFPKKNAPELELRGRAQQAGLLGGLQQQQLTSLGILSGIGAQQQALQQRAIDAQRAEFQRALGYGPQQISLLQAGMGTPLITTTQTGKQSTGLGDVLGGAAGLFGSLALGGAFGGGGLFGSSGSVARAVDGFGSL